LIALITLEPNAFRLFGEFPPSVCSVKLKHVRMIRLRYFHPRDQVVDDVLALATLDVEIDTQEARGFIGLEEFLEARVGSGCVLAVAA
jgi:hypothetical protein